MVFIIIVISITCNRQDVCGCICDCVLVLTGTSQSMTFAGSAIQRGGDRGATRWYWAHHGQCSQQDESALHHRPGLCCCFCPGSPQVRPLHVLCAICISRTDISVCRVLQAWWDVCLLIIAEGAGLTQTLCHPCCKDRQESMEACNAID